MIMKTKIIMTMSNDNDDDDDNDNDDDEEDDNDNDDDDDEEDDNDNDDHDNDNDNVKGLNPKVGWVWSSVWTKSWIGLLLLLTVTDSDNLCGSHLQSQSELYHVSWWYYTMVIDLNGQLSRDVIGRLSVKPW